MSEQFTTIAGTVIRISEADDNISIKLMGTGPMVVTGLWLPGQGKDVEVNLRRDA